MGMEFGAKILGFGVFDCGRYGYVGFVVMV